MKIRMTKINKRHRIYSFTFKDDITYLDYGLPTIRLQDTIVIFHRKLKLCPKMK